MKSIIGSFVGTGAILSIGLGFKPSFVRVVNITSATLESIEWNKAMLDGADAVKGGIKRSGDVAVADAKLAVAAGIIPYTGGEKVAAGNTALLVRQKTSAANDYAAAAAGVIMPDGFTMAADADVNVAAEVCYFEAGFDDAGL
jgi:hypothetical protein